MTHGSLHGKAHYIYAHEITSEYRPLEQIIHKRSPPEPSLKPNFFIILKVSYNPIYDT